jgi:peptide/nickel transport system permease protein
VNATLPSALRALPGTAKFGLAVISVIVLVAVLAPLLATHDPADQSLIDRNQGLSADYWLGTDKYGRDVYSRLLIGARYTLGLSVVALSAAAVTGTFLGLVAAYNRDRWLGAMVVWWVDVFMTFPTLILGVIVVAVLGQGLVNDGLGIAIAFVPRITRMARGVALNIVVNDYVEAALALGASSLRIVGVHLLRNVLPEMAVITTLWLGTAIEVETSLSFLGLGVQPPAPSWGNMIREGIDVLYLNPWPSLLPVMAILATILGLNLLADGLQDVFNPTLRER